MVAIFIGIIGVSFAVCGTRVDIGMRLSMSCTNNRGRIPTDLGMRAASGRCDGTRSSLRQRRTFLRPIIRSARCCDPDAGQRAEQRYLLEWRRVVCMQNLIWAF